MRRVHFSNVRTELLGQAVQRSQAHSSLLRPVKRSHDLRQLLLRQSKDCDRRAGKLSL